MAHNLAQCVKLVGQAAGAGAKVGNQYLSSHATFAPVPYFARLY
jgi:hypothetical protein